MIPSLDPPHNCTLCPRLANFREDLRLSHSDWFNAPVPIFGDTQAWLAVVGLAPGMQGANRTGRPFTGDFAGILLYKTLMRFGMAHGDYDARADDGLTLHGTIIVNAVRCLPPQNKPTPEEIRTCQPYLKNPLESLRHLKVVIALGQIAHQSVVRSFGVRLFQAKFGHGAIHTMPTGVTLIDSYHCSRYNQNTRVLTAEMFESVFKQALAHR